MTRALGSPETAARSTASPLATVDVAGAEIPWWSDRRRPAAGAVVLLPGLGWRTTGYALQSGIAASLPVVAFDYPRRWPRRRMASMAQLAATYATALERLGVMSAHVTGVSMGGMLGLQLALDHPHVVASLAVVSSAAAGRHVSRWRLPASRVIASALPPSVFYHFYRRWGPFLVGTSVLSSRDEASRLWTDPMSRRKMVDLLAAIARFDVRDRLPDVTAPTLVLHGAEDAILPAPAARELARGIGGSRLALVEGAGHFAFLTHADRVLAELHGFWRERGNA